MKIKYYLLTLLVLALTFNACNEVDDGIVAVPERDRAEQQIVDNDSLLDYFDTHYYNYMDLQALMPNSSQGDIIITELPDGETVPAGHALLSDPDFGVEMHSTVFEEVDYKYYILKVNQGGGLAMPNFTDNVQINFSGNTMDEEVFDSSVNPVIFDLTNLIPGWSRVMPKFNVAQDFMTNPDGTISFINSGVGVMFIPSGLAYFSGSAPGVPVYSNLIFKFDLYNTEEIDHDADGVPSHEEDLDGDFNVTNDDTDDDQIPNAFDNDDDNDGTFTLYEDLEPDMDLEDDADGDGIATNDIGDGDPTNDDTDGDDTPNYLDEDDDCSNQDDEDLNGVPDCDN